MKYLIILLLTSNIAIGDCAHTLSVCNDVVKAQSTQIKDLKAENTTLKEALEAERPGLIPGFTWFLIGGLIGVASYGLLRR